MRLLIAEDDQKLLKTLTHLFEMDHYLVDGVDNGIRGTVVYRMIAVHQKKFLELSARAKEEPERYTVKASFRYDVTSVRNIFERLAEYRLEV